MKKLIIFILFLAVAVNPAIDTTFHRIDSASVNDSETIFYTKIGFHTDEVNINSYKIGPSGKLKKDKKIRKVKHKELSDSLSDTTNY